MSTASGGRHPRAAIRRTLAICLALALVVAAACAGYEQIFSTSTDYDDEGYVMLSVVSYVHGKALYDETFTQYGPVYFLLEGAFFAATGLPVSHDVTRTKTLLLWILAAILAAAVVRRLGGSMIAALAAFLVAFFHLERLALEPGHPQELAVLGLLVVPLLFDDGRSGWRALALGCVLGAVIMTKANLGVFLLASTALWYLLAGDRSRLTPVLRPLVVSVTLVLPFLVVRRHLLAPGGVVLPGIVAAATLGVVLVARRGGGGPPSGLPFRAFLVGLVGVAMLGVATALASGTTARGLVYGLVGQHVQLLSSFASPAPIPRACVLWAVVAAALATRSADTGRSVAFARAAAVLVVAWMSLRYLAETFDPLTHGLVDRGGAGMLVGVATPVLWVLLVGARHRNERLGLCLVATLQPLGAYPSPGTQMAVGSLPIALGAIVAVDDALTSRSTVRAARVAAFGLVALLATTLVLRSVYFRQRRDAMTPLDLPGATRVRMPARDAARYRWLATTLRAHADTFVFGEHARDSFYFWTDLPPPTALNPTFWPYLLRDDEQRRIVDALESVPRPAVVHEAHNGTLPTDSPLLDYLEKRFRPAITGDGFEVWLRK